jgi:hypothetical protein
MPITFSFLAVACSLMLALSGCVAVPLAQMAVTQMGPAKAPCVAGPACPAGPGSGTFGDISKGISDSFGKLTSAQQPAVDAAAK